MVAALRELSRQRFQRVKAELTQTFAFRDYPVVIPAREQITRQQFGSIMCTRGRQPSLYDLRSVGDKVSHVDLNIRSQADSCSSCRKDFRAYTLDSPQGAPQAR
jgi:hypothetical protein